MKLFLKLFALIALAGVIVLIVVPIVNKQSVRDQSLISEKQIPLTARSITDGPFTIKENSVIHWSGDRDLVPNYVDSGALTVKKGSLFVSAGIPVAGEFVFDMNTIATLSTGKGGGLDTLSNHLKSADFFNVEKYPESRFVVTKVMPSSDVATSFKYTVTGRLTIRDITDEITFDAFIYENESTVSLVGDVVVDRTRYDIRYNSSQFFTEIGDKAISDKFTVQLNLELNR